jgi:2-amino-4-hydroxy-6-hydroxymethyldihydropteridine diphosphokinase
MLQGCAQLVGCRKPIGIAVHCQKNAGDVFIGLGMINQANDFVKGRRTSATNGSKRCGPVVLIELFTQVDGEHRLCFHFRAAFFGQAGNKTKHQKENNERKNYEGKKRSKENLKETPHAEKNFNRQKYEIFDAIASATMNKAYLLIGGNMGDRKGFLAAACAEIETNCGKLLQQSSLYDTAAWGNEDQGAFLNQALELETPLAAETLLQTILGIEERLGRKRELRYGPRIIDIDILFFNEDTIVKEGLTVPHPQVQNRRFALVPLNEIAPELMHPILKKTISQLLTECPDSLDVHKIS